MSNIALKIEDVSKMYRLGKISSGTLSHDLNRMYARLRGKEDPYLKIGEANDRATTGLSDYVWALQNISFDVNKGDSLALIGKNGAGKSTLLKLLSRVTQPTTGNIKMKGRVASLLEVGTGFHPELTGRENIYLNGAILGMRKWEITSKLDQIIAFSGVERYIDTPVKRYSSGMYVRLAFAVAAHLESEILIVDEVLAVGDAEFQRKCLGKMGEVSAGEGRTVLFVSHNMAAVKSLCQKGVLLQHGQLTFHGDVETAVSKYMLGDNEVMNVQTFEKPLSAEAVQVHGVKVVAKGKNVDDPMIEGHPLQLEINYSLEETAEYYHFTFALKDDEGKKLFTFSNNRDEVPLQAGTHTMICEFPAQFFNVGQYYVDFLVVKNRKQPIKSEEDIVSFTVSMKPVELGIWMGREPGFIKPSFSWKHLEA
ncbi:MAG: ABC transporter ATP-binding protein [Flavobacteriales bacterium]